jgi:Phosphoesterase family
LVIGRPNRPTPPRLLRPLEGPFSPLDTLGSIIRFGMRGGCRRTRSGRSELRSGSRACARNGTILADAAAGTLPNVAFVDPKFSNIGGPESDEHPFADVRVGDNFISTVFHAVRTSPQWDRTVLVVT